MILFPRNVDVFYTNVDRCYVDKSNSCKDAASSESSPGWVWSCEACDTHREKKDHDCRKRKRKNVNSLSRSEKDKLVSAMNRLIENGRYVELGNIHGGPKEANVCPGLTEKEDAGGCCRHDTRNFLNWHRIFIAHMEDELGEALPYWDWTVDRTVPDLWEGIKAPLKSPLMSPCNEDGVKSDQGASYVTRNQSIDLKTHDFRKDLKEAFIVDKFDAFHRTVNKPHNLIHNLVGCNMRPPKNAAYDPVFWLHHSFVDFVWAYWQAELIFLYFHIFGQIACLLSGGPKAPWYRGQRVGKRH